MPSTLTWIDHDAEAHERSLRILALFQERESRDELGPGFLDAVPREPFDGETFRYQFVLSVAVPCCSEPPGAEKMRGRNSSAVHGILHAKERDLSSLK